MKALGAITILLLVCAVVTAAETTRAAGATLTHFNAIHGSKVTLKGKYRFNNEWHAEGTLLCGFLEVEPGFPVRRGAPGSGTELSARGEVFIPVRNLKAVRESRDEYTEQMTGILHRMLRADQHSRIYFWLSRLETIGPEPRDRVPIFTATGRLAIAGVTNQISLPIGIKRLESGDIRISGTTSLKPSDFKIIPEFAGIIDSPDQHRVEIAFEWCLKETEAR